MIYNICLFCKKDSSSSKSIEHIVPESLGNREYVLPKGAVCDNCNNYFAIKLEKPVLEMQWFKHYRHSENIINKKGNEVAVDAIVHAGGKYPGIVTLQGNSIIINNEGLIRDILIGKRGSLIVPIITSHSIPKNDPILARFLCKIAIESMYNTDDTAVRDYLLYDSEIKKLTDYVRYGRGEISCYEVLVQGVEEYDVLHEFWVSSEGNQIFFNLTLTNITFKIELGQIIND